MRFSSLDSSFFISCPEKICISFLFLFCAWTYCSESPSIHYCFNDEISILFQVYGSAVTFYESYPEERVTEKQKRRLWNVEDDESENVDIESIHKPDVSYHVVKSICLLSHWPFFDAFEKFLLFLYNMSREGSHSIPIEK